MNPPVLVIDDDPSVRSLLETALSESGFAVAAVATGNAGISRFRTLEPQAVLLDVHMPDLKGDAVLPRLIELDPFVVVIMISSIDEIETVRATLTAGAYDYLVKPFEVRKVIETIKRGLEQRRIRIDNEQYRTRLEALVQERTEELRKAVEKIEATYDETILALGSALETRDVETQAHSLRVAGYTRLLCRTLGLQEKKRLTEIERGAILHDIGKIGVPDHILLKEAALTEEEWVVMKKHPLIGVRLLEPIGFLQGALPIVRSHHERWDGNGYPDGLSGEDIPLEARVFAVADALDAITSDRPYRAAQSILVARTVIGNGSGTQFDPSVISALHHVDDTAIRRVSN